MEGQVLLAHVTRGGFVESVHAGHAVIVDPSGAVVRSWGRPEQPILPRSASKPLLAAGMVAAGLDLADEQLAIAAASHSGEPIHLRTVQAVLADGGLSVADLANTPALPYSTAAQEQWLRAGGVPSSLAQNCSGKHAAMLRTAQVLGVPTQGYLAPDHAVQRAGLRGIEELSGESIAGICVDGCGAPVAAISLIGLARAFSRLVLAPADSAPGRVARAMAGYPMYVGGTGRDVTTFMTAQPGAIAKDGAESVHALALPDGRAAAVKIADGSERARTGVVVALLHHLGVDEDVLAAVTPTPTLGGGHQVGAVQSVF